jgi:hypothetical protein
MEHTLSADIATRIESIGTHRRGACGAQTLRKKALSQHLNKKKRLPKRAHVLFSAPILIARLFGAAFRNGKFSRSSAKWRKRVAHRPSRKF